MQHFSSNILSSHSGPPQGLRCVPCPQAAAKGQQHPQQPAKSRVSPSSPFWCLAQDACLQAQLQQPVGCILGIHSAHEAAEGGALGIGHHAVLRGQLQQLCPPLPACLGCQGTQGCAVLPLGSRKPPLALYPMCGIVKCGVKLFYGRPWPGQPLVGVGLDVGVLKAVPLGS